MLTLNSFLSPLFLPVPVYHSIYSMLKLKKIYILHGTRTCGANIYLVLFQIHWALCCLILSSTFKLPLCLFSFVLWGPFVIFFHECLLDINPLRFYLFENLFFPLQTFLKAVLTERRVLNWQSLLPACWRCHFVLSWPQSFLFKSQLLCYSCSLEGTVFLFFGCL